MTEQTAEATTAFIDVAGIPVGDFTQSSLVSRIMSMAQSGGVEVAVGVNAYVCTMARPDETFRELVSKSVTYADGQSVVWAGRLLGGTMPERLATTDIAEPILEAAAAKSIPVFFLGAAPGVAEAAAQKLRHRISGLSLRTHHGYFSKDETAKVLRDIKEHRTGILFVGMGDPVQQLWIAENRDQLPPAVLTCGGLFDWLSGANRRAPRWMISAGLEWLWRLYLEPGRVWRRYILGNPVFIAAVLMQRLRGSKR